MDEYISSRSDYKGSISPEIESLETKTSNVVFKDLPLFEKLDELLKPSILNPKFTETVLLFRLTSAQINAIKRSRNGIQVLLRFCSPDTKCQQEDHLPLGISYVSINSRTCWFRDTYSCWTQIPINITALCILSPNVCNEILIPFVNYSFVLGVVLVRKVCTSDELLKPIEEKRVCVLDITGDKEKLSYDSYSEIPIISETRNLCPYYSKKIKRIKVGDSDSTRAMIKSMLSKDCGSETETLSIICSLLCPLGKTRIQTPCRSITCTHIQCFDAQIYLPMVGKSTKWICPICMKPTPFADLIIDGLFIEIIDKTNNSCNEVKFDKNANWTPIVDKKEYSCQTLSPRNTKRFFSQTSLKCF